MARLTALSDSEDVKPAVTPQHRPAKSKRKRDPDSSESDGDGDKPSLSPQLKEKKPRIKKEPTGSKGSGKASAWSKVQVRQLWDALDMKPVSHLWSDSVAERVLMCRGKSTGTRCPRKWTVAARS